jgi:adenosylmethionine-8-amino-7-oxononanoate aminotransferase
MRAQLEKLTYAHTAFFSCEPAEKLADMLVGHEPGGLPCLFRLPPISEGMEAAIKMARQYFVEIGQPQRKRYIARRQSYHGNTLGAPRPAAMPCAARPTRRILSPAFSHVSPASPIARCADHESEADLRPPGRRAGGGVPAPRPRQRHRLLAETVVGATAGCVTALPGYFKAVRAVCDRHGALLILDEVMSGMGRTGTMHAWEQEGVSRTSRPSRRAWAAATSRSAACSPQGRVVAAMRDGSGAFQHGHTYLAHPMACAAALEVQKVIRTKPARQRPGHGRAAGAAAAPSASATTAMSATSGAAASSAPSSWCRIVAPRLSSIPSSR